MSDTKGGAVIKQVLELGPVLAFVAGYVLMREKTVTLGGTDYDGFIIVTAAFIPVLALSNFLLWKISGRVSRIQIFTMVVAVIFGGLTVWMNDERFFKMKGTVAFAIFSGLLWIGLLRGQSWLEYVLEGALPITHEGWMILTRRLAIFLACVAAANEIIWRGFSTDVYVAWDTFGQMIAIMAFFLSQNGLLQRHSKPEQAD